MTLVDIRAWDTIGEITVLVAAATGVASLIFLDTRGTGIRRVHEIPLPRDRAASSRPAPGAAPGWPAPRTLPPERRSIIFEVVTRLMFHTIVVFSIYLLFAGHNDPGGGFAAGMVTGLALMVRYLAGGRYELDEAAPVDAGALIGSGLVGRRASAAVLPLAFGGSILQSAIVDLHIPLLGDLHLVTSALFDIGVYLVVVGLVLDLLRASARSIDRQIVRDRRESRPLGASPSPRDDAARRQLAHERRQPDPGPDRRRPARLRGLPAPRAQPDAGAGRPGDDGQRRQPGLPRRRRPGRARPRSSARERRRRRDDRPAAPGAWC